MNNMRADFEKWAVQKHIAYHWTNHEGVVFYSPIDGREPAAWDAWQASRLQALGETEPAAFLAKHWDTQFNGRRIADWIADARVVYEHCGVIETIEFYRVALEGTKS